LRLELFVLLALPREESLEEAVLVEARLREPTLDADRSVALRQLAEKRSDGK
jgi:hypothetical protein